MRSLIAAALRADTGRTPQRSTPPAPISASEGAARVRVVPMASKPLRLAVPGVDYPMLRGLLAFLLSYVPDLGSIIAAVPAVLFAAVRLGPGAALWSAAGYLVVNVVVGSIIELRFMGRGLSALVVFPSLVFRGGAGPGRHDPLGAVDDDDQDRARLAPGHALDRGAARPGGAAAEELAERMSESDPGIGAWCSRKRLGASNRANGAAGERLLRLARTGPGLALHSVLLKCAIRRPIHPSRRTPVRCIAMRAGECRRMRLCGRLYCANDHIAGTLSLSGSSAMPSAAFTGTGHRGRRVPR